MNVCLNGWFKWGSTIVLAVSVWVWKAGGNAGWVHSSLVFKEVVVITPRSAMKASQMIKIKRRRAVKDSIEPKDETEFHIA